jgi:RimJ/RimL family protein N-acetyltransferase
VALEALGVMITELRRLHGVTRFEAHIEPRNLSSQRVAAAAGFARTDRSVGGEAVWTMTA